MTNSSTGTFRKALLCVVFVLCAFIAAGCAVLAWFCFDRGFFTMPKDRILSRADYTAMKSDAYTIVDLSVAPAQTGWEPDEPVSVQYAPTATNLRYVITNKVDRIIASNVSEEEAADG